MFEYPPLEVKVWGELACFTRPEMKVERVSYSVMTPSAARGILEAIFWKPEFSWIITEIQVLKPIRHISLVRNELKNKQSERSARSWEKNGGGYFIEEDRTQRHTLALRDVAYLIKAQILLRDHAADSHVAKYRDQFRRRVSRGQYFHHPYLGNREFPASFAEPDGTEQPIDVSDDLGRMLFDIDYSKEENRNAPQFFSAELVHGIMEVPTELYKGGN